MIFHCILVKLIDRPENYKSKVLVLLYRIKQRTTPEELCQSWGRGWGREENLVSMRSFWILDHQTLSLTIIHPSRLHSQVLHEKFSKFKITNNTHQQHTWDKVRFCHDMAAPANIQCITDSFLSRLIISLCNIVVFQDDIEETKGRNKILLHWKSQTGSVALGI